jgi:hypothetical protein
LSAIFTAAIAAASFEARVDVTIATVSKPRQS